MIIAGTVASTLTVAVVAAGSAQADYTSPVTFDAVTAGYGLTTTISNSSIPAGLTIEGDGPVSNGHLSSLGESNGVAAFPYPGDSVAGLPGVGAGVLAGLLPIQSLPVPGYPAQVKSSYGTPAPKQVDFPGVTLASESDQRRTQSRAVVGTDSSGASTQSTIKQDDDGNVVATTTTAVNGAQIGPEVTLSGITSTVTATLKASGKFITSSSLSIAKINIPGIQLPVPTLFPPPLGGTILRDPDIGFTDGAFSITSPLDGTVTKFPIPAQTVFDLLKAAGITATYEAPITTASSIVGGTFTLDTLLPAPPANQLYNGPTHYTFALGRVSASIDGAVIPLSDTSGFTSGTGVNPVTTPPSAGPGSVTAPTSGSDGLTGTTGTGSLVTPGDVGALTSTDGQGGSPPVVAGQGAAATPSSPSTELVSSGYSRSRSPVFWLYLVVIGVGIVGAFSSGVLRYGGIRSTWRS
jgi:hypothetical protein